MNIHALGSQWIYYIAPSHVDYVIGSRCLVCCCVCRVLVDTCSVQLSAVASSFSSKLLAQNHKGEAAA